MNLKQITVLAMLVLPLGCGTSGTDVSRISLGTGSSTATQHIAISNLGSNEENQQLARALAFYDRAYFVAQLDSMNDAASTGIALGYFVSESTRAPSFQITYDLGYAAVKAQRTSLVKEFESFVPALAARHIASEEAFEEADVVARAWLQDAFAPESMAWHQASSLLRAHTPKEQMDAAFQQLTTKLGQPVSFQRELSQAYLPYAEYPECVLLLYKVEFSGGAASHITIRLHGAAGAWRVMGFFAKPYAKLAAL